jgi:hypothetical protein
VADVNFDKNNFDFDKVEVEHFKKALNWLAAGNKWPSIRDAEVFHIKFDDKNYPLKVVFDQACYIAETGNPDPDFKNLGYTTREVLIKLKKEKFAEIDIVKDREKEIRTKFKVWLGKHPGRKKGTPLFSGTVSRYLFCAEAIYKKWSEKQSGAIPSSIWGILDPEEVDSIRKYCKEDSELYEFDRKENYSCGLNGLNYYKEFLDGRSISSAPPKPSNELIEDGKNIILYGVPGCGKSYAIKKKIGEIRRELDDNKLSEMYRDLSYKKQIVRVVFHPDYTYSDFIGQILPEEIGSGKIAYKFRPGPFTNILKAAIDNDDKPFFLIIEEINRGNAAAIFGDLFQLLDRDDDGESVYQIDNHDIQKEVYSDQKIYIPPNLWLLATMNTSDQNVFPLDTAFQRRWEMELIPNDFEKPKAFFIGDTGVTWKVFAETVNDKILGNADTIASGDKRLGAWFIRPYRSENFVSRERFANKVLKYLWDDAFKFNPEPFFNPKYKTLEEVIKAFVDDKQGFDVLLDKSISFDSAKKKIAENEGVTDE